MQYLFLSKLSYVLFLNAVVKHHCVLYKKNYNNSQIKKVYMFFSQYFIIKWLHSKLK